MNTNGAHHMSNSIGTVKWFSAKKGYGFIVTPEGQDAFVHHRSIRPGEEGYKTLIEGEEVEYKEGVSGKGLQATEVWPLNALEESA